MDILGEHSSVRRRPRQWVAGVFYQ
uniref:Uncharacterized protein n=1 Tax=Arundo donax TaxID=35708 RepID=A0A0A8Z3N1_ARUDO